jgi:hypothetical protein
MKVMLYQLDGKIPNIALMRLAAHHRERGDEIIFRRGKPHLELFEQPDVIYGSCIFLKSRVVAEQLLAVYPQAIIGGTGWSVSSSLEQRGINTIRQDYSIYPSFRQSIGFTQRGCRLRCKFCVVPEKEGAVHEEQTISGIWRGDPWPRELLLLDNDFFGQSNWRARIAEIRDGSFKVSFNQGINARFLSDEAAEAVASVDYRDDSMKVKRVYTAWDNLKDEQRLFDGLSRLVKYGVKPDHIMVYMLCGYWPGETQEDREYRRRKLREFGCRPYPMIWDRTPELLGFQRWVIGAYDKESNKNHVPWSIWAGAKYEPRNLGFQSGQSVFEVLR